MERSGTDEHNPLKAAILAEGRGRLALAGGRCQQAVAGFGQAVRGWRSVGRAYDQLRALDGLGRAQARASDLPAAQIAYDEAVDIVEALSQQLERPELRASFLHSPLVRGVSDARRHGNERRPRL